MKKQYHVERKGNNPVGWLRVFGTEANSKQWCLGYVHAMDSLYPSAPYRIIQDDGVNKEVVCETKGRAKVTVN